MIETAAGGRWQVAFWFAPVFVDVALKSVLLLLPALGVAGCMRKSSAAARHLVWFLAVASLVLLPILSLELPGWHILPRWLNPQFSESPKPVPPQKVEPVAPLLQRVETGPTDEVRPAPELFLPPPAPRNEPIEAPSVQIQSRATRAIVSEPPRVPDSPRDYLIWVWILGAALALLPVAMGSFSLWRLQRGSRRETAASWLDLLRSLAACLNFRRTTALFKTHRRRMPMTWGILRTKLLLPEESDEWGDDRRRVVLLHELAHAKRWDYLTNLVTQLVCALYWFNPLVWIAARRMVVERERACDDIVLRHGAKPADYAEQVLQIAAGLRLNRFAAYGGIPMARPSKLEERLRAILDGTRNRAALTRMVVIAAVVLFTAIVVPVAMMRAAFGEQTQSRRSVRERIEQLIQSAPGTTNENLTFGPMVDGLRAAVELIPTNGDFLAGQPIPVRFHIRNESDYAIQIASESGRQGDELILETETGGKVLNESGLPAMISQVIYSGWSAIRRQVLKPGEEMTLESHTLAFFNDNGYTTADQPFPVGYAVHTKPGRYVIRFRLHFPGWNAQLMDWKGELETGPTTIGVKENASNSAQGGGFRTPTNASPANVKSATASPAPTSVQSSESLVTSAAANVPARPFIVAGRVTDEQGNGLTDVMVTAQCGQGTLQLTGKTNTDADGYYILRFAEGMHSLSEGTNPPRVMLQAATISAGKPGFSETNLNRGGDLMVADRLPAPGDDTGWKFNPKRVVLPNRPYQLNFVMRPAARVVGLLFDKTGQPMRKTRLWIDGDQLPPSCNVLAETETDSEGQFDFDDVPTGFLWRFNVLGKTAQGIRFDQAGEHSIVFGLNEGVVEILKGQPATRVIPVHQRINGLPEKGVSRSGKLLSGPDLALLRIHEQFHGWGSPPLVTDTNTLRVLAITTNSEVSVGESFPVELRIQNTTTNKVAIYVMSCSWYDQWVTTEPLIDWERWPCFANYPELVELAPGRFCPIVLKVFVTERPPGGKLTFRLGFIQGNAFPEGILSFFWSNEITVTVKDGSQTHAPAGAASPKGNANQSQPKTGSSR